jgi:hypothetical protein
MIVLLFCVEAASSGIRQQKPAAESWLSQPVRDPGVVEATLSSLKSIQASCQIEGLLFSHRNHGVMVPAQSPGSIKYPADA